MNWLILAAKSPVDPTGGSPWGLLLPWVLILGIFWIMIIMPQRKQQKQRNTMLKSLKKGDKVITLGGMHGEIVEIDDEDVKVRVAEKLEIKLIRSAISKVKN